MKNGINITENDDGSFVLEWDQNHPIWSMFNNMTKEEINDYVNDALRIGLEQLEKVEPQG